MKATQKFFNGNRKWLSVLLIVSVIMSLMPTVAYAAGGSEQQIVYGGGTKYYDANGNEVTESPKIGENAVVALSKTIEGTAKENVFDITLQVDTTLTPSSDFATTPDAAVVLTIDMSGTMETGKMNGTTRVEVAKAKAKEFVNSYAASAGNDSSAKRMLAITQFNTYATTLQTWVDVNTAAGKSAALAVINGITVDMDENDRCTNVESATLLTNNLFEFGTNGVSVAGIPKSNRWAIFLSDGAPTVGIKDSEKTSTSVTKLNNDNTNGGGTNVSDVNDVWTYMSELDGRANLFFVGVSEDMDKTFVDRDKNSSEWSKLTPSVNKTSETVGSWLAKLADATGGQYIAAKDAASLTSAFSEIAKTIQTKTNTFYSKAWTAADPIGEAAPDNYVEFLGFYSDAKGKTNKTSITKDSDGDTASVSNKVINWDLKASNSTKKNNVYTYSIKYQVRLTNEAAGFVDEKVYDTNGRTTFQYQIPKDGAYVDGNPVDFPIPQVEGYVKPVTFTKISSHDDKGLGGCTFKLVHNTNCTCGIGTIAPMTFTSLDSGEVTFNRVPSGHVYTLTEESAADGYDQNTAVSQITVSYGTVSESGDLVDNNVITNTPSDNPQVFTVYKEWTGAASVNEVTVYVHQVVNGDENGPLAAILKLSAENGWTASTEPLPTVDVEHKTPIVYRAVEASSDSYKLLSGGDFDANYETVLNNVRTGTSNIVIQKNWKAPSDLRSAVNVQLLQNGKPFGEAFTLREGSWSKEVSVPAYDNAGNAYKYTVVELDSEGNAKSDSASIVINGHTYDVSISGTTITNTIQQEYTSVSGTKTWNASGLSDAEKSALSATITLYQNGEAYKTETVTYTDTSYSFNELPKYTDDCSTEYTYTVAETAVSGNASGTWTSVQNGTSFTNTIKEDITISGTKSWVDQDESERPESITIKLMSGTTTVDSVTISAEPVYGIADTGSNNGETPEAGEAPAEPAKTIIGYTWKGVDLNYSFTVPKYDSNGAVIPYHIAEDSVNLYQPTYDGYDVTNTLNGGEKTISAQKIWVDAAADHEAVTLGVFREDNNSQAAAIVLNEGNGWTGSATVAKYADGAEIEYFVRELNADGSVIENGGSYGTDYTVDYTQTDDNWIVKNQIRQEYISVSGQKTWAGGGVHPEVTFTLYKNDVSTGQTRTQADLNPENGNKFTFEGLEKYEISGNTCTVNTYTIKETMSGTSELLARYSYDGTPVMGTADGNGVFQFVNTFTNDVTTVSGQKTWYGMGYSQEVKVGVFAGDTMVASQATKDLKYEFTGLTKYNTDGTLVQYTIAELDDQGTAMKEGNFYKTSDGKSYEVYYNGYNIDNILKQESIDVSVTKVWRGTPASSATFELYRAEGENGTPVPVLDGSGKAMTLTLTAADANPDTGFWEGSFRGLDVYNAKRTAEYIYSVVESGVVDGRITLDGNTYTAEALDGNLFTNTIVDPKNGTYTVNKVWAGEGYTAETGEPVTVQLFANDVAYGSPVTLNKDNGWTYTFTGLPLYTAQTYSSITYTAGELDENGALIADGGIISMNDGTERYTVTYNGGTITNTLKDTDSYKYRVLRHYTYSRNGEVSTFTDHDSTWTTASRDEIINIDAGQWTDCSTDDMKVTYKFQKDLSDVYQGTNGDYAFTQEGKTVSFVTEKYVDGESYYEVYLYYNYSYTKPYIPPTDTPEYVNVSVTKVWDDNDNEAGARPDSVTVQLVKDGEAAGTSELSEANGWSHTWTGLEADHMYGVAEVNVADGYVSSVTGSGTSFTVVNTYVPVVIEEPDVPLDDKELEDPEVEIMDPDVPLDYMEIIDPDVPKTSDESGRNMWLILAMLSAMALAASVRSERKERS